MRTSCACLWSIVRTCTARTFKLHVLNVYQQGRRQIYKYTLLVLMIHFHQVWKVQVCGRLCKHAQNTTKPLHSLLPTTQYTTTYSYTVFKYIQEIFLLLYLEKYKVLTFQLIDRNISQQKHTVPHMPLFAEIQWKCQINESANKGLSTF